MNNVHPVFAPILRSFSTPAVDHLDRLRAQRQEHFQNALWWKRRYQQWGSPMALAWFRAEANLHRLVNRELWKHRTH